jgi:hypothetical protein
MRLSPALSLAALVAAPALADTPPEPATPRHRGSLTFYTENDKYFAGTDQAYTNGFKISYLSGDLQSLTGEDTFAPARYFARALGRLVPDGHVYKAGFSLGQNIYTPVDTQTTTYIPGDRPYAAWLYGGVALHVLYPDSLGGRADRLDVFEINLGIVGPSAVGEDVQNGFHEVIDVARANGWDNQIEDEPGVNLIYERRYRLSTAGARESWGADFIPHAGAEIRAGWRLPADFGSNLIRPSGDSNPDNKRPLCGVFVFAAVDGRAVVRDITLDGNTFKDSPDIDKKPFVADGYVGIGVSTPYLQLRYAQAYRTKEFEGQQDSQVFGSLSATILF